MNGSSDNEQQALFMDDLKRNLGTLIQTFHVELQTQEDFHRLLTIRDKFYFLVLNSVMKALGNTQAMRVKKSKDELTFKTYMDGYRYLIDFYLKRIFEKVSEQVRQRCPEQFRYLSKYDEVGFFYHPDK